MNTFFDQSIFCGILWMIAGIINFSYFIQEIDNNDFLNSGIRFLIAVAFVFLGVEYLGIKL